MILTDEKIGTLASEVKVLPDDYRTRLLDNLKPKSGSSHKESEIRVIGEDDGIFFIKVRQNSNNAFDFSVILVYEFPDSSRQFRLRRYNGRTTPHHNKLENERVSDFHVHYATERYQEAGFDEDAYAEQTDRYTDVQGALKCLIEDCGFVRPEINSVELF